MGNSNARAVAALDGDGGPSVRGLVGRFVLAALVALALVAAVTAVVSRRTGVREAEREAKQLTWVFGSGIVEPALTKEVLAGEPSALDRFDATIRASVLRGSLVRVKLWRSDGQVVYSDEQRLIGEQFALDASRRRALQDGSSSAEVSTTDEDENEFETANTRLLEVYTGVRGPDGERLLFETYFEYSTVLKAGRDAWRRSIPVSLAALALLQLVQIPIVLQLFRGVRAGQVAREGLLRQSVHASATERRRIASDLHDGVVQELTGVSYSLSAIARDASLVPSLVATIESNAETTRNSVHGLRSLLVDIYPPNLATEGLENALAELLDRLEKRGLRTELTVDIHGAAATDATALVYRGALEATRNVTRHARASRVAVSVSELGSDLVLTVEDDGTGFDPETLLKPRSDGHVGMQVLGDTTSDFGGSVMVESALGRGTKVTMRVPAE